MFDLPQSVMQLAQSQLAMMGRIGASAIRVTPTVPVGQPSVIRFLQPGYVLGLYGQTTDGTPAGYGDISVRILINGDEDFFVDGLGGPAFGGFLGLFGGVSNWFPVMRRVWQGEVWVFTFASVASVGQNPTCQLAMLNDLDVARMQANAQAQAAENR